MESIISITSFIYPISLLGAIVLTIIIPFDFSYFNWLHYTSLKKAKKKLKKFWKHCHLLLTVLYFPFFPWFSLSTRPKICLPSSCHSNFSGKEAYHLFLKCSNISGILSVRYPTFLVWLHIQTNKKYTS